MQGLYKITGTPGVPPTKTIITIAAIIGLLYIASK
jgi:hypothetical protein